MNADDLPLDVWAGVREVALAERTTPRQIYWAIDQGLAHSRIGTRIRIRRCDWRAFHERHLRGVTMDAGDGVVTMSASGGRRGGRL